MSSGEVTLNDTPTKSKLYRFCEKKIDQWAKDHVVDQEEFDFVVSFNETETKQISCTTEIHCGGHTYRGWDLDHDTQQAFIHSLKRLQPH